MSLDKRLELNTNKAERRSFSQYFAGNGKSALLVVWWIFWLGIVASGLMLSQWQWQRAEFKRDLLQQQAEAGELFNPQSLPANYSLLTLSGHFIESQSLWLDNRVLSGSVGVALLTPFIDVNGRWWLVDRGFVATGGHRGSLDKYRPVTHEKIQVVSGQWQLLNQDSENLLLGDYREGQRLQVIKLSAWPERGRSFDGVLHLHSGSQVQLSMTGEAFIPWWKPSQITPERHIGYSLQWLLLAALALLFAIIGRRHIPH